MQTKKVGQTTIEVSSIGLGGMPLSIQGRPSEEQALRVIKKAFDLGLNFIDTADVYCLDNSEIGHNERLIRKAIDKFGIRNEFLVATKGGLERPEGQWIVNASPKHLQQACEASLVALNVESIALYQLHAPDPDVPFRESIEKLVDLKQQGKIQHIGLSNVEIKHIQEAQTMTEVVSVQNRCNVHDLRSFHHGIVDYCEQQNISFIAYSPVGGKHGKEFVEKDIYLNEVAKRYEATSYQVALAWLLAQSKAMIPIPGATRIESIEDSVAALSIELSQDDLGFLNNAFGRIIA